MNNKFNRIIKLLNNLKKYKESFNKNKVCRICFEEIKNNSKISKNSNNSNNSNNLIISPCKCKGSIRWVHHNCLLKWIKISKKKYCQSCNYNYDIIFESDNFLHNNITIISILSYFLFSVLSFFIYNLIYKKKVLSRLTYTSFYHSLKIQIIIFCFLFIGLKFLPNYQAILNNLLEDIYLTNHFYYNSIFDFCYYFYKIIKKILTISINYYYPRKIKINNYT